MTQIKTTKLAKRLKRECNLLDRPNLCLVKEITRLKKQAITRELQGLFGKNSTTTTTKSLIDFAVVVGSWKQQNKSLISFLPSSLFM